MNKQSWNLVIQKDGLVVLPDELWHKLRRMSGVKSKKKRIVKKVVRKLFIKLMKQSLER